MIVTLTPGELEHARLTAANRQKATRGMGVDASLGSQLYPGGAPACDAIGAIGELAVAKALNVYPEMTGDDRPSYGDGTYYGLVYDAKTSRNDAVRLLVNLRDKDKRIDFFVLAILQQDEREVDVRAGCFKHQIVRPGRIADIGNGLGDRYVMEQGELTPIECLLAEVRAIREW